MTLDATDEAQLLGATAQGRCLFTFNVRHFPALAHSYPRHGGIILAAQQSWTISDLIAALDRLLSETKADEWTDRCAGSTNGGKAANRYFLRPDSPMLIKFRFDTWRCTRPWHF